MNKDDSHTGGQTIRIRDGFPNQRLIVIPQRVRERCRQLPLVESLYVSHIGSFPSAPHHYVKRPQGTVQAILIYCLAGRGVAEIGDGTFAIERGNALVIPPHTPHLYRADEKDPWSIFWIHFRGSKLGETLEWLGTDLGNPLIHAPDIPLMHSLFEEIYACLNYHYSNDGLLAMSSELLRFIARLRMNAVSSSKVLRVEDDRISESIAFMQRHLDLNINLEELARQAGQSVSSYSARFKDKTGESPINFHIQLKMRKACELLDSTDMMIAQIAELLGYEDPAYFSRYFKKIQGCSPLEYRQALKS
jgi:AraC family transcriptional regulator, arabinose operon regulatory protein